MPLVRTLYYLPEAAHPEFIAGEQALIAFRAAKGLEGAARRAFLIGIAAAALRCVEAERPLLVQQ